MSTREPVPGATPGSEPLKTVAQLRADTEAILQAAIAAVDPERLVVRALEGHKRAVPQTGRVRVAGFGKAAIGMARGVHRVLGGRVDEAVLLVPAHETEEAPRDYDVFRGGHPIPDPACVAGANAIRQMARELEEPDLLICLVSGGGSSLLTLPPEGLPVEEIQQVTDLLLRAGASIQELNCVRKHLDRLKGGQLAREAAPGRVLALVLSDVVGDPLDVIASGPVSPDPTRFADAVAVLKRYHLWSRVPLAARGHLDRGVCGEIPDTPTKGDPLFLRTTVDVIGNGRMAARAACEKAESLGYESQLLTDALVGEAREAGTFLAETARILRGKSGPSGAPTCIVAAGETTVTVRGAGLGGRCQEIVLGAALGIEGEQGILVAAMGTDGIDGPTDAAGAIATGSTVERARKAGFDPEDSLLRNDAHPLLESLGDLIVSGPTGTNVADLQLVLLG